MRLTETAITNISGRHVVLALALALDFSEQWVIKVIAANKNNGPLTTAKALELIKKVTGLTDAEILEDQKEPAK